MPLSAIGLGYLYRAVKINCFLNSVDKQKKSQTLVNTKKTPPKTKTSKSISQTDQKYFCKK